MMRKSEPRRPLGDFITLQRGTTYKSSMLGQSGPYLLGLGSIARDGGFKRENLKTYGGESDAKILLRPGDVYVSLKDVTQSGDLLGAVARVPDTVPVGRLTQDTVKICSGSPDTPIKFIYWALRTPDFRSYCRAHATGTTNLGLPREDFLAYAIPDFTEARRALTDLLDDLEKKADLNQRMNETLEAMARAIFRDWFVDFGPTRAKMEGRGPYLAPDLWSLFPSRLDDEGKPEGWVASTLGAHAHNFDSKRIPVSGAERRIRQGPYPYHGAAGIMDHVDGYLFDGIHLLIGEDGSVIKEAGLAVTQYVWGKFWVNNHAHVLRGKPPVSTEQLYLYFQCQPVEPYVTGAVQPKLSQGRMNTMPFLHAGEPICRAFAELVHPLFARIRANIDENETLAQTRDLLLPKLMSGEIRVREAQEMVEAAG